MARVLLPSTPVGMPVSTVVFVDGLISRNGRRVFVRLACGHERVLPVPKRGKRPGPGVRVACRRCAAYRTPRAYRAVVQLAALGLTEREVEYIAGRLAEQRDRVDGGK